jgi:hypothetical protein
MPGNKITGNIKGPGPGRPKGATNKVTGEVKAMILAALDKAGGVDYLAAQALETPAAFMSLVGKVLPLQLTGDKNNPVYIEGVGLIPVAHVPGGLRRARFGQDQIIRQDDGGMGVKFARPICRA